MIIAIPIDFSKAKYQINKAYVEYVAGAGYIPYLATPHVKAKLTADVCNGLLLPGGIDIDPIFYGESNYGSYTTDPEKDDFERQLLWAFMKAGKPVFGICRGFQLIAREYIYHKGDNRTSPKGVCSVNDILVFDQHIEDHALTERLGLFRTHPSHYVNARLDLLAGEKSKKIFQIAVNSMHHQYLYVNLITPPAGGSGEKSASKSKVTPHMWLTAWTRRGLDSEEQGVVAEGFTIRGWGNSKIAAVQWHPEELKDYSLIQFHFGKLKSKPAEAAKE